GRVLVAGGSGARDGQEDGALASAELYDPATATWSTTGTLSSARTGHQAVLLDDGRVLVTGGLLPTGADRAEPLAYCEVFDPADGEWSTTGSLGTARAGHQAVLLADHRVLVTGGDLVVAADGTLDPHSLASAELYDPVSEVWSPARPMPDGGRSGHRAISLRSGEVLVTGGTGAPERSAGFRSVISYDPRSGTWRTLGGLLLGRSAHAVAELPDDRVLAATGVAGTDPTGTGEVLIP
ncbi:Kelch repeat-containing protein, partial [Nonomuraea guangzhouensis]